MRPTELARAPMLTTTYVSSSASAVDASAVDAVAVDAVALAPVGRRGRPRGFGGGQYTASWARNGSGSAVSAARHATTNACISRSRSVRTLCAAFRSSAGGRTVSARSACWLLTTAVCHAACHFRRRPASLVASHLWLVRSEDRFKP